MRPSCVLSRRCHLVILQKNVPGLSARALDRFIFRARKALKLSGKVNVLVTGSAAIRALNREFRKKDQATDVLSFPAPTSSPKRGRLQMAGEIAISAEIALENAGRLDHKPAVEVKVLALHGLLHLAGFDHERDNGEMARKEERLRRELRLPVALIERTESAGIVRPERRYAAVRRTKARGQA